MTAESRLLLWAVEASGDFAQAKEELDAPADLAELFEHKEVVEPLLGLDRKVVHMENTQWGFVEPLVGLDRKCMEDTQKEVVE